MCRMVVFSGTCTRCGAWFQWDELSQELSCLEAKNNGGFGDCRRGVQVEDHGFDQECDACAEEDMADEGLGDMDLVGEEFEAQGHAQWQGQWQEPPPLPPKQEEKLAGHGHSSSSGGGGGSSSSRGPGPGPGHGHKRAKGKHDHGERDSHKGGARDDRGKKRQRTT